MRKKQFKAESKRLLDLVINSIYTHREIFLRELISNASDAIDKIYYTALTDDSIQFNKEDYFITLSVDKEKRQLTISDSGIGMTKEELEENLGIIARSGSLKFKEENEGKDGVDIIGQFGVGFYSAFLVAETVIVRSKAFGSEFAYAWESQGIDGYTVTPCEKDSVGTDILITLKENTEDENYDEYLEEYRLRSIVKKYSDFIRYPIKMEITRSELKEGTESEYQEVKKEETINSMVPIWRKNKNELTEEDYQNFYMEKRFGFDQPVRTIHSSIDGNVSYNAVLFIPGKTPYDFYTREYEKGLELYSRGVMIMEKCGDLLPDYFSFVKGVVDSEDLSLNISREVLQHDRQLKLIAKNIKTKVKSELLKLMKSDREKYESFYESFGRQLKYGVYSEFGTNKEFLQDLLLFSSSHEKKLVSLKEYAERMKEDQKYIYYAAGQSVERLEKMPQTEMVLDKGYEILYFTEEVDEFAIQMMRVFNEKEFKSVSANDLGLESEDQETVEESAENEAIFTSMMEHLSNKVKAVRASKRLKTHPVCLTSEGEVSIEMEKILNAMPSDQEVKAEKILEININHEIFQTVQKAYQDDPEKFALYTDVLYQQALLIEGLPIEDPVAFTNQICKIMK